LITIHHIAVRAQWSCKSY